MPKSRIYAHEKCPRRLQQRYTDDVARIVWRYKLASETTHLPARSDIEEFQVFSASLNEPAEDDLTEDVLRCIDRAIRFSIILEVVAADRPRVVAVFNRSSDADSVKWAVGDDFMSAWLPKDDGVPLPVSLVDGPMERFATILEEEYNAHRDEVLTLFDSKEATYLKGITASKTHDGYFSIAKNKRMVDPSVAKRGESAAKTTEPVGTAIHIVPDHYATHGTPAVERWLAGHPEYSLHFTPTSAGRLNRVGRVFAGLTQNQLRRGVFTSVETREKTALDYIDGRNEDAKPCVWTADANAILGRVAKNRAAISRSGH